MFRDFPARSNAQEDLRRHGGIPTSQKLFIVPMQSSLFIPIELRMLNVSLPACDLGKLELPQLLYYSGTFSIDSQPGVTRELVELVFAHPRLDAVATP
ncbi:hypothetical protein [Aureliella helgolandensis]|uniref:hypothetical protein n=1 Tax=Aureliella helgolandensis TaxID=2527968 RepID=UPI0011A2AF95|nr:hypothetical protein [Aureliella helgolandensis]